MKPICIVFLTFIAFLTISSVVSDEDGPLENAGETVDNAASDVRDWGKGAIEDTGKWIKGAGEDAGEAIEDIADRKKRDINYPTQEEDQPKEAIEKYEHNEDGDSIRKYIWGKFRF